MRKIIETIKSSFSELKSIKTLCIMGMLGALSIVINQFTIQIGDFLKIGFSNECNVMIDCLFGPVVGAVFGGGMDILKFIIKPTGGFFFGWTLSAILAGVIMGFGLYKKKITYIRLLIVRLANALIINAGLGTLWLDMMYGNGFLALLPARLIKNIVAAPVEALIFFVIYKSLEKAGIFKLIRFQGRYAKSTN